MPSRIVPDCMSGYKTNPAKFNFITIPQDDATSLKLWKIAVKCDDVKPRCAVYENHVVKNEIVWQHQVLGADPVLVCWAYVGRHYRINKFLLNLNGQWPYAKKRKKIFFTFLTFAMFFTFIPAQIRMVIVHRTDWLKILPALGPLFVHIACAIKMCNSIYYERQMRELMERIYDDWHAPMGPERKVLQQFADDGRLFTMIYTGVLYVSTITYLIISLLPRLLLVNGWANITTSAVFAIPIYFTPYDEEYYAYIQADLFLAIVIVLSISIAVDSMFVVYVQHGCGIFAAVSYRLENLVDHDDDEIDLHPPRINDKAFWIVVDCIKKHNKGIQ